MNGPTCVRNPIARERPHPQLTSPARWRTTAKWSDRDHHRVKSPSGRDIADVTDEVDSLRMNLRQAKHALATRDEETRRLRAAVTHLESTLAQRERELRDTVSCLRGDCPPRPHQEWLQEGAPSSRLRLQVHKLQRAVAAKQDHIEHLNRQASLGFLREAREQADEYRIEAKRLARALAAITADHVRQSETSKSGDVGFGQNWDHNQLDQARAAMVVDQRPRSQPGAPQPRHVHRSRYPAPHPTADSGGFRDTRGESRARPDGETWPITMRKCLGDRSREGSREDSRGGFREGSLPWGSIGRGTPPATAPTGGGYATWREEIQYESLGLRPPLSSAARLPGAGIVVVPSSAVAANGGVYVSNSTGRKTVLSRRSTGARVPDGIECWGPRQRYCSRGSTRPFDENARTSSMACSARLRSSAQQRTAERNVALALGEESRRRKAAREARKRAARLARQKIARYREERLRELESRHARSCGTRTRSSQLYPPASAIDEEQQPHGSSGERGDGGNSDRGEGLTRASDDRNDKAQGYNNAHDSKQRRAVKAARAAAVEAASYVGEEYHGLHVAEYEPPSCHEKGEIDRRDGSTYGVRRHFLGVGVDGSEATETWHGRDCGGRDYGSCTARPVGKPLGKPPLAPSRTVPSPKTLSLRQGPPSEVTDGRYDGTDEDNDAKKMHTWDDTDVADEVQTEATSADSVRDAGGPWRDDEEQQDDDSVWEENMSANWGEGLAAGGGGGGGGGGFPAPAQEAIARNGTTVNPGKSSRGNPDGVEQRHDNRSGRPEGSIRHGRGDESDVGQPDGFMRGAGLNSSAIPDGKRPRPTESEPSRSSSPEPSTYPLALAGTAMGECVQGEDPPVAGRPREKTRVRGGNVDGTGNVSRCNTKSGQTTTPITAETDEPIVRGGQHGGQNSTPDNDHRRGAKGAGEARPQSDPVTRSTAVPPDSETNGLSTAGQAHGESRILTDSLRLGGERGTVRDSRTATDNPTLGGEGGEARDNGSDAKGRVGNAYAGGEEREERRSSRGGEMDDDDSYNSRWSLSAEDATQGQGAALVPDTSVGVECVGGVTVNVPEYQDDFFEGSARQDEGTDISFAVSTPSEEKMEAFRAAPTSTPSPVISAAPPPQHQARPNLPAGDPMDDEWLITEPPTMTANQTRLGEAMNGRRNLRRPRSAGGNRPDTRLEVSPPVPRFGPAETRETEGVYSAPAHALSEEEEEEEQGTGLRTSPARLSTPDFVHGKDATSLGASTGGRQRLTREGDPPTAVGSQLTPLLTGGNQQPQCVREDDGVGESANSNTLPPASSSFSTDDVQGELPSVNTGGGQLTPSLAEGEHQPQSLKDGDELGISASKSLSPALSSSFSTGVKGEPGTVGSQLTPMLIEGEQQPQSLRDSDGLGGSPTQTLPPTSSSFPRDDDGLGGSPTQTLPPMSSSSPTDSSDMQGEPPTTMSSQSTPMRAEGGYQQLQESRALQGGPGSITPRPTLPSRTVSSESHADSSVGLQATSSREGDTSAGTLFDDPTVNAQVGAKSPDDGRGSSAASGTEASSAAGERERSSHGSDSVLENGSGGGIDTAADNDDGYF